MSARSLAVITGASSGIGEKLAMGYAKRGYDLVIVARRAERLADLARTLSSTCNVHVDVVAADLKDDAGLDALMTALGDRDVDVFVNNAGVGWIGRFVEAPYARQLEIVDLNCRAVVALTHRILPRMLARGAGQIVQVASVAGFMPGPLSSVYYASKAFVVSHSEALRHELRGSGVTVTLLCPGPVETEFQRSSGVDSAMGGAAKMTDVDVAEAAIAAAAAGTFLCVPGPANRLLVALSALLPRRLSADLVARLQQQRLTTSTGR
jgi:short-subunit dehydrogenase